MPARLPARENPTEFHEGGEVVLAEGPRQETDRVFLHLERDAKWADIEERNSVIRGHLMEWLAHSAAAVPSSGD